MDPMTNPLYNTPFTSKDLAKEAVAKQVENLQTMKSVILTNLETSPNPTNADSSVSSIYDMMKSNLLNTKKNTAKQIVQAVSSNLEAIGYWISATNAAYPALTPFNLITTSLTDEQFTQALDTQCQELASVMPQLLDMIEINITAASADPRIQVVFTNLSIGEQQDFKSHVKEALYVYADNLRQISNLWS